MCTALAHLSPALPWVSPSSVLNTLGPQTVLAEEEDEEDEEDEDEEEEEEGGEGEAAEAEGEEGEEGAEERRSSPY